MIDFVDQYRRACLQLLMMAAIGKAHTSGMVHEAYWQAVAWRLKHEAFA